MTRTHLARLTTLLFLLSACAGAAAAQQQPADQAAPSQPPAIRFDAKGLTLLDAVKLTLQHDPNIKLREVDSERQQGVLRSERGVFDPVFHASGNFDRAQTELLTSERQPLQEARDDLRLAVAEVTTLSNSLLAATNILGDGRIYSNPRAVNFTQGVADADVQNQMNILGSQLVLFDSILKSPQLTDPTVKSDIVNLRSVTIDKNVANFLAQRSLVADAPGLLQKKLDDLGATPNEKWNRQGRLSFDVAKTFRSGFAVAPYVDLTYGAQNYVGKSKSDPLFGGMGLEPIYTGQVGFEVVLPFLRGRGRNSVAAGEIAAKYDLEASRLAVLHQQSQSVLTTIQAYWQARAALDQVDVLRRSVELQGELATITRALIAAKEKARSDEARVMASTADARGRYEAAQKQLNDARTNLAKVMGVALADVMALPMASDAFPRPPEGLQADPTAYAALIQEATARRYDRQAALKSQESGKALVEGARIDTRQLVNLNVKGWGTSQHETTPGYNNWVFRSGSAGIDYEVPFGNNVAMGLLEQRRSAYNQTRIDATNIERLIALNITQYAESLKVAADRLKAAEEAVRNYDQTIQAEQARFKGGDASLLDTILTEQQTTSARLAFVTAQQEYATLLAALRYEAGLLVQDGAVNASNLVAVPAALVRR